MTTDPENRLKMARRLAQVRKSQHLLSQWHVAQASRRTEAVQAHNEAIAEAIGREPLSAGAYAEVLQQQARKGHVHLAKARQTQHEQQEALRQMSQKLEQSKRLMQRYDAIVQVEAERSHLDDIIDQIAQRPDTSLDPA